MFSSENDRKVFSFLKILVSLRSYIVTLILALNKVHNQIQKLKELSKIHCSLILT